MFFFNITEKLQRLQALINAHLLYEAKMNFYYNLLFTIFLTRSIIDNCSQSTLQIKIIY